MSGLVLLCCLWLVPPVATGPGAPTSRDAGAEEVTLAGTVVPLAEALKARGIAAEADLLGPMVVLRGADGTLTPLIPNGASKALFTDERLRGRPAEVVGWRHAGVPGLEVVAFRVQEQGTLRTPEYYCDVCTISVRYPQACPCCQGPMELRYKPAPPATD